MIGETLVKNMVCPGCGSTLWITAGGYIYCDTEECTYWEVTP